MTLFLVKVDVNQLSLPLNMQQPQVLGAGVVRAAHPEGGTVRYFCIPQILLKMFICNKWAGLFTGLEYWTHPKW